MYELNIMKMEKLSNIVMFMLLVFSTAGYGQSQGDGMTKGRDIVVYRYDSKVFKEIADVYNDSIRSRCHCNDLDLAWISFFDSTAFLRARISPLSGMVYNIDRTGSFEDSIQIGLKLEGSENIYLVLNRYMDLVKSLGNVEFLFRTDVWDFMSNRTNDCIFKECTIRLYRLEVDYYWRSGIVSRPASFYYEEKMQKASEKPNNKKGRQKK